MRKLWLIIKREYITRVKTKGFVIGTLALPLLTIGVFVFSILVAMRQPDHTLKLAILDDAGGLSAAVTKGLNGTLPNGQPTFRVVKSFEMSEPGARAELRAELSAGRLDGYLVIPKDISAGKRAEFHSRNPGDIALTDSIARAVSDAVIARRLSERGVRVDNVGEMVRGVDVKLIKVSKHGESEEKGDTFLVAIVLAMVLYTTMVMYGVMTMRAVLEEKTSRIMEVLVSAARPFQLMAGKILGVGGVALTQYLIWSVSAALLTSYGFAMASTLQPGASAPHLHLPASLLVYFVVYFLLGYFLHASIYAAIGAAASNEQDAQQLQWPATLPLIFSFVMFNFILRDPNSHTAVMLSLIPFFTPILMLLRISAETPPFWQIALSMALTVLTTVGVVYFSARIYRVGVLMYGKRPSLVELFRWLRYS